MPKTRILVVDDEEGMLEVCADTLNRLAGTEIVLEQDSRHGAERLRNESFDLVITDIRMPGVGGLALLRIAREHDPHLAALIITAYPTVETAVESMKLGAADYIVKPFLPERLLSTVQRLLESKRLGEENRLLRRQVERVYTFGDIIGRGAAMLKVFECIRRVSDTDFDVLLIGESGTGKELVARAIHQRSRRKAGPFVPVDCGAIPEQLMESEFFGHERGAFTGALSRNLGLMELAHGGTLFLDEISQLPARLQSKLLRALQERTIRRVGCSKEIAVDLRVVAASSLRLADEVAHDRFRLDLYHRLNATQVDLPPLRDRTEDIPLLTEHFVAQYAKELNRAPVLVDEQAIDVLKRYRWPGNVRELQNVIKRALTMSNGPAISLDDLAEEIVAHAGEFEIGAGTGFFAQRERKMLAYEKEYLRNLLSFCHGDVTCAAREAELPRGTLYRLMKKHDLNPAQFRAPDVGAHI